MTDICLLRHAESEANVSGILCGNMDVDLTHHGEMQLVDLKNAIQKRSLYFDNIYSSPLKRTVKTAVSIARQHQSVDLVDELMEQDTGKYSHWQKSRYVMEIDPRMERQSMHPDLKFIGGESLFDVQQRAVKCMQNIASRHKFDTDRICVVSHKGFILTFLHAINKISLNDFPLMELPNCSAVSIRVHEKNVFKFIGHHDFLNGHK